MESETTRPLTNGATSHGLSVSPSLKRLGPTVKFSREAVLPSDVWGSGDVWGFTYLSEPQFPQLKTGESDKTSVMVPR